MGKKILLDTDIGVDIDDALCLTYLLSNPDIELLGITTVSGESEKRCCMSDVICQHMGKREVPIYPGCEFGLNGMLQSNAHQAAQIGDWPHRSNFPQGKSFQFMIDTIRKFPGEVTLVAVGPLTNIGILFNLDPEMPDLLQELVIMGGRFYSDLDSGLLPEYNISKDPLAAEIVFQRGKNIRCVGLDVTLKLTMQKEEATKELTLYTALEPTRDFAKVWFGSEGAQSMTFHDPLAAAILTDESCCEFEQGTVSVELTPGKNFGWTYFAPGEGNVKIASEVYVEQFFKHYFHVIQEADASRIKK